MIKQLKRKKVLVSGIQPSGRLHLGNYFGAIKQMVDLVNSNKYESYIFLADYHSMTSLKDREERKKNTLEIATIYLACGMDSKKVNIFKQSDVPEVTELTWILNTVTPLPMLSLAHAFKEKSDQAANNLEEMFKINVGLFDYPVLMAADILIYGGEIVPVGQDQVQHVEYTRELAKKYNLAYQTNTFKYPKEFINQEVAIVPGMDGKKMSKSRNNQIALFGDLEEIKKRIMSITTDSKSPNEVKNPDENNIYNIHKLFLNKLEIKKLRERFLNSDKISYNYKEAKENLFNSYVNYFKIMQEKYEYYTKTEKGKKEILKVLSEGAKRARKQAEITIQKIRRETGLDF